MVEYNKYDDLKEQPLTSNLIDGASPSVETNHANVDECQAIDRYWAR